MNKSARTYGPAAREAMESRFARSIAARLSERAENVAPEIGERLRFAREKALEVGRLARAGAEVQSADNGTAILGISRSPWWQRIASVLPLAALIGGLVLIEDWTTRSQISVAAEVDAALLGDDLPINAYRDPGFVEYLKSPPGE
jgi:Tfp pilus assembly protein FimT